MYVCMCMAAMVSGVIGGVVGTVVGKVVRVGVVGGVVTSEQRMIALLDFDRSDEAVVLLEQCE